jgi:hypothetical protein
MTALLFKPICSLEALRGREYAAKPAMNAPHVKRMTRHALHRTGSKEGIYLLMMLSL